MKTSTGSIKSSQPQAKDHAIERLLVSRREDILRLASKYGARNVRVFGSVARGEADEASDIDFLVDLEQGRSLLDLGVC